MTRVDPAAVATNLVVPPTAPTKRVGVFAAIGIFVVLATLGWRMSPHPVGAARTYGKYQGKATSTAEAVNSEVATTRLVARAASRGKAFGPYTSVVVSDSEEAVSSAQGTFDSIQPPDARADALRRELDGLIGAALEHIANVRIAARRGELSQLAVVAQPLAADSRKLRDFTRAHS